MTFTQNLECFSQVAFFGVEAVVLFCAFPAWRRFRHRFLAWLSIATAIGLCSAVPDYALRRYQATQEPYYWSWVAQQCLSIASMLFYGAGIFSMVRYLRRLPPEISPATSPDDPTAPSLMSLSRGLALGLAAGVLLAVGFPSVALAFDGLLNEAPADRIGAYAFNALGVPVAAFALTGRPLAVRLTYVLLILFFLPDLVPILSRDQPGGSGHVFASFASAALSLLAIVLLSLSRKSEHSE